jgi:hypothetical protein
VYLCSGSGHTFDPLPATVRDCTVGVSGDSAHRIGFASPLGKRMAAASWLGKFALCLAAVLALPLSSAHSEDRPIASTATHDGKAHVDVLSLKRTEGGTVTLRFVLANDGEGDFSMVLGNMHLVDLAARRSYRAGLMSSSCSTPPGRQVNCWATFAAPPEATKTLAVQFYENLDLLSGVPVAE